MKAKYNGFCKTTNQPIIAGETEIVKINGVWQCEKSESAMARNDRIKSIVMAAPEDYDWEEAEAEIADYEAAKRASAQRLHAQFPDTPAAKWLSALEPQLDLFPRPIQFTSAAKEAAFNAEIAKL